MNLAKPLIRLSPDRIFTAGNVVFLLAGLLLLSGDLRAQSTTATILGTVHDSSGGAVPGASVHATNVLTGQTRTAQADPAGDYTISALPIGNYRIEIEQAGFKKFARAGVVLELNRNARVDATLEVGAVTEIVDVTGNVPMIDTHQVQIGALVDSRRVQELPLSGRNVYDLVSILPGVSSVSTETISTRGGNQLRINGSRSRHSTFMLDGGFNNSNWRNGGNAAPNPDAVQEFNVITSNFNAEYGRAAGPVINVVTRSGTNELHASLHEFLRNDKLNARNFFQPTVATLRQNQFGGTAGGPVIRNRTFFFASHESLRIRSRDFVNSGRTPTAAERRGDFSAAPANSRPLDPLTRQLFPGALIPASRFDAVSVKLLQDVVPLPNTPDGRVEAAASHPSNQAQWLAKLDHNISSKHRLFGTFFYLRDSETRPFAGSVIPGYSAFESHYRQHNFVVNETWVPSATLLNEARVSYTRHFYDDIPLIRRSWQDWGSKMPLAAPFHKPYPPVFNVSGRWTMGTGNENSGQADETTSFNNITSWTKARHNLRFGTWFAFSRYDATLALNGSGEMMVQGDATNNAVADFVLGRAARLRQSNGALRNFRKWDSESFFQDDWKITKRITLNLGLRYELSPRFSSLADDLQTLRPGVRSTVIPGAPLGFQYVGDPGIPRAIAKLDKNNWAPRFGIAIDPFGNGRTAIRAGYGIFYSTAFADAASFLQNQPFQLDLLFFGIESYVDPYAKIGGNPFPAKIDPAHPFFTFPTFVAWLDDRLATPYVQQYSLTLQHQLTKNLSVQLAYVGNNSRKLLYTLDANPPVFAPGATAGNIDARRPIQPGVFGQISKYETASNGHYNALQVTVERRMARGFSIVGNYTYGKAIDEISDDNDKFSTMASPYSRKYDRAVSTTDIRQIMNISYVWESPSINAWGAAGRHILGGWQLSGVAHIDSGKVVNITAGRDVNLDGLSFDRPNVLGNPKIGGDRSRDERIRKFFETSAFQLPQTGSLGTAGRNLLYGPATFGWNFSAVKSIRFRERHTLQFRSEFFNFINRVNLQNPTGNFGSPNFGRILSADPARVVQFALKYKF